MLRPTATSVFPEDNYILRIVFDNGETKRFDVKPYIQGEWYGKLADKQYFRAVRTDGFTVVWPGCLTASEQTRRREHRWERYFFVNI